MVGLEVGRNLPRLQLAPKDGKHAAQYFGKLYLDGGTGLAVKTERLPGDVSDPLQLSVRHLQHLRACRGRILQLGEIDKVGNGLQRVVDLMRNGRREAARGGQLLGLAQRL